MCADHIGVSVHRNLEQTRSGGHDISGLPGWAPEIKARKAYPTPSELGEMWEQCTRQAQNAGLKPVLVVKVDRRGWQIYIRGSDLVPDILDEFEPVMLSITGWFAVYRAGANQCALSE